MNGVGQSNPNSVDNDNNLLILLDFIFEMRKIEMSPAQCRSHHVVALLSEQKLSDSNFSGAASNPASIIAQRVGPILPSSHP
jgi:hypothetical protein